MASYWPNQTIEIAEPCHEEWDGMTGDARRRHCAACNKDVHNTAALTPRQIEALLAGPGSLPCLRIARHADGSILVAEEARPRMPYGALTGAAMTALVSITSAVAAAQTTSGRVVMGAPPVARAVYSGNVIGPDGKPAAGAHVSLSRSVNGKQERIESQSDAKGSFHLQATPGQWQLDATGATGPYVATQQPVTLHNGEQSAAKPLQLQQVFVSAGIIAPPKPAPQSPKAPTMGKMKPNR